MSEFQSPPRPAGDTPIEIVPFQELHSGEQDLVRAACKAAQGSYAPYSQFPVGAAVRTGGGKIFTGANVENASYGATVCAERTAVFNAITASPSYNVRTITAVAVCCVKVAVARQGKYGAPCGMCRQVLVEFRPKATDMLVLVVWEAEDGGDGQPIRPLSVARFPLGQLMPLDFGPASLT